MESKLSTILISILLITAVIDLRSNRIPNYLTYTAMIFGLLFNTLSTGTHGLLLSLSGTITGIGILIIFYFMGGMGAGDVKLLGVVGSFLGATGVFWSFLFSAVAGGFYSIILILIYRKKFSGTFSRLYYSGVHLILTRRIFDFGTIHTDDRPRLCYGLAIAVGTGTYMFMKIYGVEVLPL